MGARNLVAKGHWHQQALGRPSSTCERSVSENAVFAGGAFLQKAGKNCGKTLNNMTLVRGFAVLQGLWFGGDGSFTQFRVHGPKLAEVTMCLKALGAAALLVCS